MVRFVKTALLFILVRPLSKIIYRRINKEVTELLWLEIIWLFDWWANVKVELYTDQETYRLMGKEPALVISNHRSDIDWLVGWVLAQRVGCLGSPVALAKKSLSYLLVLGWSMWFAGYISLERSWAKDEHTLKSGFRELNDFHQPFWLAVFVEGTRFTHAKLLLAQEYAVSAGIPIPRNVLIPRTKVHVRIERRLMKELPEDESGCFIGPASCYGYIW
ncbi:1-acyl-sn-glycerol-3-phosphate acyltransferase 2 [Capsicum annuum]|nr:1-acyl-sn-glycerol-3-phosphate acyltransferase 2 [Capsicum annuum]